MSDHGGTEIPATAARILISKVQIDAGVAPPECTTCWRIGLIRVAADAWPWSPPLVWALRDTVMLLPVDQVSLAAENDSNASATEADAEPAAVAHPMLLQPLLQPRIIFADTIQLKGVGHVLLLHTFDHCPHSRIGTSCSPEGSPVTTRVRTVPR